MKKLTILFLVFSSIFIYSQSPNDISGATSICGDIDFTYTPTGPGVDDFLTNANPTCLSTDPVESQSIWLRLTFDTGGSLEFTLIPNNNTDDYDWALFDVTTAPANSTGTQLRCSSTMFLAPNGATGLGNGATDISEGPGTGDGFLAPVNVNAGDVLLLFINNWSSSTSGFDLSFGGTAAFNPPPTNEVPVGIALELEECDSDGIVDNATLFDLTVNSPIMIGTQTGVAVTFYEDEGDAQIGASNDITIPAAFHSGPQTIYARITNIGTECFSVVEFELIITGSLNLSAPDIEICDDDNDALWDFDLTQSDTTIINGQTGLVVSYHESENDANNDINPIVGLYPNTSNPQILWARLDDPIGGCFGVDDFKIEIFDTPIALTAPKMVLCDDDNNGTMPFVLTNQNGLINTDVGMTITYHPTQTDADNNANTISSPFESSNTTIYTRVENDLKTDCYTISSFDLEVYDSAFPLDAITIANYSFCDNNLDGDDTNGFIEFDLTQKETEILNGQSVTDFTLTYFKDSDYNALSEILTPTTFTNTVVNGQTIYVRMTNNLSASCYTDTSFDIEVYSLPVLNTSPGIPPYELIQCDDPSNDAEANFNLYQANGDVINPVTTETFIYYTSEVFAIAGVPGTEIPDATVYPVTGSVGQVWVRVVTVNDCFRTAMVDLIIRPSQINPDYQLYQCDDFLDIDGNDTAANDDTDGITSFDFQDEIDLILAPFAGSAGVSVSCHHTEADSDAGINPIDPATYSNYRNKISANQEKIWVRIVSTLGNDCLANGNFITLNVNPVPIANVVSNLELCDNDMDGVDTNGVGVEFDLESQSNLIREAGETAVDFSITYHLSAADAISGADPQSSPFTNTANGETIYVRVLNTATGCINPHLTFNLDVNPLPIIDFTNISLASICDNDDDGDDTNEIGVEFDLGSLRNAFENLQPDIATINYTVTYHENLTDAQAIPTLNPLPDVYPNIVNNQTVFVRIENEDTGCIRIEESPIYLVVDPLPVLTAITVTPECDNDDDGDDTNESITWILTDYIANFTAMQTGLDPVTITFHTTLLGASSTPNSDEITTTPAYPNVSNPEQIFVRVTNDITGCFRAIHAFDLEVNPLPEFDLIDESIVCENILPHEISAENPLENDYTYEWFNSLLVSIGNSQTLQITNTDDITTEENGGVDYTIVATNPTTGCKRPKTIRLYKSSIPTITDADIFTVEFSSPNNSIEVITTSLGSGNYQFALEHDYDSRYYQDDPIFTGLVGGIYTLLINDKNGCGETSIEVVLIDYPKFLTPNNDDYNDTWKLVGIESKSYSVSPIQIFDRFGKVVAVIDPYGDGWDGYFNGEALPSSDYWFALQLTDILGITKIYRGHFSLVRR